MKTTRLGAGYLLLALGLLFAVVAVYAGPSDTGKVAMLEGPRYYEAIASNGPVEWTYGGSTVAKLTPTATGLTATSGLLDWTYTAASATAITDLLSLTNLKNASSMTGTGAGLAFNQWYYHATTPAVADSGRIAVGTLGNWTSTASTQDAYMSFQNAINGTVAEKFGLYDPYAILTGAGTAKAATPLLYVLNTTNAADMDGTHSAIEFDQYYYDAATPARVDAGFISCGPAASGSDWTSTASTQDASMDFQTAVDGTLASRMTIGGDGAVTVAGAASVNGNATLGDASTDTITCTGRLILRQVTDAGPMTATGGTKAELVYNLSNDKVYVCTATHETAATWAALH